MDCARRQQPHIQIRQSNGKQTGPSKKHVPFIQKSGSAPRCKSRASERRAGKAIQLSSRKMAQRMARKSVERKKNHIRQQNERTNTHAEMPVENKSQNGVMP